MWYGVRALCSIFMTVFREDGFVEVYAAHSSVFKNNCRFVKSFVVSIGHSTRCAAFACSMGIEVVNEYSTIRFIRVISSWLQNKCRRFLSVSTLVTSDSWSPS